MQILLGILVLYENTCVILIFTLICPLVYSNLLKDSDNVSFNGEADLDLSTESLFMQFQNH